MPARRARRLSIWLEVDGIEYEAQSIVVGPDTDRTLTYTPPICRQCGRGHNVPKVLVVIEPEGQELGG